MNLPLLPQDKANHALYGAVIACVVSATLGPWWAVLAVCAVGVLKEVSDWWQNRKGGSHGVELWDAAATIAGGAAVVIPQVLR